MLGVEAHKKSDGGSSKSARALGLWLQVWLRRGFWVAMLFASAVLLFVVMGALGQEFKRLRSTDRGSMVDVDR